MYFAQAIQTISEENAFLVEKYQKLGWSFDLVARDNSDSDQTLYDWTAEKIFNVADKAELSEPILESLLNAIKKKEIEYSEVVKDSPIIKPVPTEPAPKNLIKRIERTCRVDLTEDEVTERGKELIQKMDEKDAELLRFSSISKQHKSEIDKLEKGIRHLRRVYAQRYEYREVACQQIFDYEKGVVIIEREDTSEVIDSRPMRDDERQPKLPIENENSDDDENNS